MTDTAISPFPALTDESREFLLELLDTPAPSGFEGPASDVWTSHARSVGLTTRVDVIGSSFAVANEGASKRVALVGHLDEIGLIVTRIDDKGFLRTLNIGGWDIAVLVGQRVRITSSKTGATLAGSVCRPAVHALDAEARRRVPLLKDLWVDIGAESAEAAKALVAVGDTMVIDVQPIRIGEHRIVSRSADNRVGAFVALEVARRCIGLDVEVIAIGSVGEEIGGHGAYTATSALNLDAAVALDVTTPSDTPTSGDLGDLSLGKGPIITRGATTNTKVAHALIAAAESAGAPFQLRGLGLRTSTDADQIVRAWSGVATGLISIPARYLHSPCEQFDLRDVVASIELLVSYITELGATES
ncbi:MAG: M42 family peptidase [Thermoleophilia bacterium]|nr:M42 family peptidase [Thermoleophilia bacterium]